MTNQETEQEKKWREEFEKWSEDEESPNPYQTDMDYAEYGEACYIAACKKRQEEIDRLSNVITISNRHNDNQYAKKNEIILALENRLEEKKEEVDRLRANHEEFARKMGDEIHVRNNHVRELKASNEQLRAENEKHKEESLKRLNEMLDDHWFKKCQRLKNLVERAKPIIASCVVHKDDPESQWLKDSEVIGE